MKLRIFLTVTAGVISISFASIFIRFCEDVPSVMIATYRMAIASGILILYSVSTRRLKLSSMSGLHVCSAVLAGFFLALHFSFWISSLKYTSVASSVVLVTTNPIFVGFFSWIIFGEKLSRALIAGIILSVGGSFVMALGDSGTGSITVGGNHAVLGDALALAGAVMASGYLLVGSRVRESVDVLSYVVVVYTTSSLFLLTFSLLSGLSFSGYRISSYVWMVLLAVVPQIIGHTAINWALKHLRPGMVAVAILGEPVGASLLAYWFFSESLGPFQLAGMILIFTAILLASRNAGKSESALVT